MIARHSGSKKNFSLLDNMKHQRIIFLMFFIFLCFVFLFFRIFLLQVTAHGDYKELAEKQHYISRELFPERGVVHIQGDEGYYPIAVNKDYKTLYIVPKDIPDPTLVVTALAPILGMTSEELYKKFNRRDDPFEVIKKRLDDDIFTRIDSIGLPGVHFLTESNRYYPSGTLAAQIIGFVGSSGKEVQGQYGIEAYWNDLLSGKSGHMSQIKDTSGRWISVSDRVFKPAENGADIVLTLSQTVQHETEQILRETLEKHDADSGTIIVMEPKTGKILALASLPSFDPNRFSDVENLSDFLNPAVNLSYESGSIFKPIVMAMGIDSGVISPDSQYNDPGVIHEAGYSIRNAEGKVYGLQTMTQVLEESINTGMVHVEKLVGNERFLKYMDDFGFGSKTGIEVPGEISGNIYNLKNSKGNLEFFTASFGQGIAITPIQIVTAYSALANGGTLMKPQIIDRIFHPDGREEEFNPVSVRQVISKEASQNISQMLRSVVVNGHGKRADVPGYLVGGKTGSAEVASSDKKGYDDTKTIGSFIGYAPLDDPKFVVLVKIDNPKDVMWAESSSAPAFARVMSFLLDYYKVPPTEKK